MPFHRLPDDLYSLILKHAVNMSVEECGPDKDERVSTAPPPMNRFYMPTILDGWPTVPDSLHVLDGGIAARLVRYVGKVFTSAKVSDRDRMGGLEAGLVRSLCRFYEPVSVVALAGWCVFQAYTNQIV